MEAVSNEAPEKGGQVPVHDDEIVVHPHLYEPLPKPIVAVPFGKQLLKHLDKGGDKGAAKAFASQLEATRQALSSALTSTGTSEESVHGALNDYLALLLGLVEQPAAAGATASAAAPEGAAEAAEGGAHDAQGGLKPNSPLRGAVSFAWDDVIVSTAVRTCPDALFELASVLTAVAVWYERRAAELCRDSATGVASKSCVQANQLLRKAAGLLDYVTTWLAPLLPAGVADDCSQQVLKGLSLVCLGDCQALAVLRAIQKGNQPALIAGIASDTVTLYANALQAVLGSGVSTAANSKLAHYLRYKQASLQAYAHCFSGITQWKAGQAGAGLRCLQEAQASADAAKKAYSEYDKAQPATLTNAHRRYDEILQAVITDTQQRIDKENSVVFFQKVAQQLPEAPPPKRLVAAAPFALPQQTAVAVEGVRSFAAAPLPPAPAAQAAAAGTAPAAPAAAAAAAAGGKEEEKEQESAGCSCIRWLVFLLVMPLVLMISLVGIVVWIILLPVKILCCPCGCLIQLLADLVEYLIKAPLRLVLWANGKPWEPRGGKEEKKEQDSPV